MGVGTIRVGKITATGGDGTYTFTEQLRNAAGNAWENASAAAGVVGGTLQDVNDSTVGAVDDLVLFWLESGLGGHTYYMTDVVGLRAPVLDSRAFVRDYWFEIQGEFAIAVVDATQDFRNRVIDTTAYWNPGTANLAPVWQESGIYIYDINDTARAQADAKNLGRMVYQNPASAVVTPLLFVDQTEPYGDFYLKVDQDTGELHALSENYYRVYNVRVRISAGAQVPVADKIDIT